MNEKLNLDQFANTKGLKKIENNNKINIVTSKASSSKIFYFDEENNIVPKEKATNVIIVEYDEEGNRINEIYGDCNSKYKNK